MRLILFDIDGTLLDAHGAGSRALMETLLEIYGRPFSRTGVHFAGRTDQAIVTDLLRVNGIEPASIADGLERVFQALPAHMARETARTPSTPCAGVPGLLDVLTGRSGVGLGLVTGNLASTARIKLASASLLPGRFQFGAFGDDSADRTHLPPLALERAERAFGKPISSAIVVGDTPADIQCAQANGLIAMAVSTGPYSMEELADYRPDFLLPDLTDLEEAVRIMEEGGE